jgi:hypothetical protein
LPWATLPPPPSPNLRPSDDFLDCSSGGTGAAVANAVCNPTGVRIRDCPITLDKLLPGLAARG